MDVAGGKCAREEGCWFAWVVVKVKMGFDSKDIHPSNNLELAAQGKARLGPSLPLHTPDLRLCEIGPWEAARKRSSLRVSK
jgi:hypothetical protein